MPTEEELIEALRQADAAGNTADAEAIAQMIRDQRAGASFQETAQAAEQGVNQAAQQLSPLQQLGGATAATVSGLSQGLTFGFSDELGAAIGAPFAAIAEGDIRPGNIAQEYQEGVEGLRQQYARQREQYPLAFVPSEVTGALATSAAAIPAQAARGFGAAVRAGGLGGATAGGGYADAETLGEFAGDVAAGGAFGAAGGGVLNRLGAAFRPLVQSPQTRAAQILSQADPEFDSALQQAKASVAEGRPAVVADFLSRRAKSILRGAARRPSAGQDVAEQVLDTRSAGQYSRLQNAIDDAFDVQRSYVEEFDYLNQAKSAIAGELYETAFAQPTPVTPRLQSIMQRPAMQRSLARAQQIADIEGGSVDQNVISAMQGAARPGAQADTRTLFYMRRALDDQINNLRDQTTGRFRQPEVARALTGLRRDFNNALRETNQPFQQADEVWGGLERSRQALEQGVKAAGKTTERGVRDAVRRVDPNDRAFFEIGYAQGLNERIGRSGSDFTNLAARLRSPEQKNAIRVVLGDQRARNLIDTIDAEDQFSRTRNLISPNVQSPTAEVLEGRRALGALRRGEISGVLPAAIEDVANIARGARQSQIDEQLLRLGTGGPQQSVQALAQTPPALDVTAPLAAGLSPLTVQLLRE